MNHKHKLIYLATEYVKFMGIIKINSDCGLLGYYNTVL